MLVTGASGQLGTAFRRQLGETARFCDRSQLDIVETDVVADTIRAMEPSIVINCAAYTAVDRAEDEEPLASVVNGTAVGHLATVCGEIGARFVTYSTDYVFDGTKLAPYVESDTTAPINAYGRSKLIGEERALAANRDTLVVRTSWVLSGTHPNFASTMIRLAEQRDMTVVDDQRGRPTIVDDLVHATLEAIEAEVTGILHLANDGVTTWFELARQVIDIAGGDPERIQPCESSAYPTPARRPRNSVLDSERRHEFGLTSMPHYRDGLERIVREILDQ